MVLALLFISIAAMVAYDQRVVRGLVAEIAERKGLDERKWQANRRLLGPIALLYLRSILTSRDGGLKKTIGRVVVIQAGLIAWICWLAIFLENRNSWGRMSWTRELLFLLFGPGKTWRDWATGFGIIAVISGMAFLIHRWLSRGLRVTRDGTLQ
jgi:hypothetical protein